MVKSLLFNRSYVNTLWWFHLVHDRFAVAVSCELVNTVVKSGVFEQLRECEFLKKGHASWGYKCL